MLLSQEVQNWIPLSGRQPERHEAVENAVVDAEGTACDPGQSSWADGGPDQCHFRVRTLDRPVKVTRRPLTNGALPIIRVFKSFPPHAVCATVEPTGFLCSESILSTGSSTQGGPACPGCEAGASVRYDLPPFTLSAALPRPVGPPEAGRDVWGSKIPGLRFAPTWALESRPFGAGRRRRRVGLSPTRSVRQIRLDGGGGRHAIRLGTS